MPVIARDAIASDHLVYAWPFPIGPDEYEIACAEDEQVVMCPAWTVGGLLGPGRHRWRTPTPMSPVSAYFVLTAPVEVSYDMMTTFPMPSNARAVRIRASGSLQVRCTDPSLLIAQFVGLPFDVVNDGILRSVSRSVERMLARLLTRRAVVANTPAAVTDAAMLAHILEELVAYNPAAGAVFGIELVRMGHLSIAAGDASQPWDADPRLDWSGSHPRTRANGTDEPDLTDTARGRSKITTPPLVPVLRSPSPNPNAIDGTAPPAAVPAPSRQTLKRASTQPSLEASGEIVVRAPIPVPPPAAPLSATPTTVPPPSTTTTTTVHAVVPPPVPMNRLGSQPSLPSLPPLPLPPLPPPPASPPIGSSPGESVRRVTGPVEVPSTDEITQPGIAVVRVASAASAASAASPASPASPGSMRIGTGGGMGIASIEPEDTRGSILGIGVAHIGSSQMASGEIANKVSPGARVLVPGPNGLMQSATVRQLLQGYYELEVGGSGETIWVPVNGVVPE